MPIRVLVVDDHDRVRHQLRSLLSRAPDIEVVGEASNGNEALNLIGRLNPDVLLLDIEMPGMNGLEVARELKSRQSRVIILAISAYNDRQYIIRMLDSGAAGYLVKDEVPSNLIIAIREIVQGKRGWLAAERHAYIRAHHSNGAN
jgi:DNA-binding NarL/FixJ family response regulator